MERDRLRSEQEAPKGAWDKWRGYTEIKAAWPSGRTRRLALTGHQVSRPSSPWQAHRPPPERRQLAIMEKALKITDIKNEYIESGVYSVNNFEMLEIRHALY